MAREIARTSVNGVEENVRVSNCPLCTYVCQATEMAGYLKTTVGLFARLDLYPRCG